MRFSPFSFLIFLRARKNGLFNVSPRKRVFKRALNILPVRTDLEISHGQLLDI